MNSRKVEVHILDSWELKEFIKKHYGFTYDIMKRNRWRTTDNQSCAHVYRVKKRKMSAEEMQQIENLSAGVTAQEETPAFDSTPSIQTILDHLCSIGLLREGVYAISLYYSYLVDRLVA